MHLQYLMVRDDAYRVADWGYVLQLQAAHTTQPSWERTWFFIQVMVYMCFITTDLVIVTDTTRH